MEFKPLMKFTENAKIQKTFSNFQNGITVFTLLAKKILGDTV